MKITLWAALVCLPALAGANDHLRHRDTRFAVQKLASQVSYVQGSMAAGARAGGAMDRTRAQLNRTLLDARGALGNLMRLTAADDPRVTALHTQYAAAVRSAAAMHLEYRAERQGPVTRQPLFSWSVRKVEQLADPHAEIE